MGQPMMIDDDQEAYQIYLEQERDKRRAEVEVQKFLGKCLVGMQTRDDVDDVKRSLRVLGVGV